MGKTMNKDRARNKRNHKRNQSVTARIKSHLRNICFPSKYRVTNKGLPIYTRKIIKGRIRSLLVALSLTTFGTAYSQWRIVLDPKAVAQVEANTAMQLATENAHNAQLDSVLSKQKEILDKTSAIAASKELALQTLNNIEGFGVESMWYKQIAKTSKQIVDVSPKILTSLKNSGIENKALITIKVSDLVSKATQCVNDFVNIVNNSKVRNPLNSSSAGKGDGHNLLDRYERMTLAAQIYGDLQKIKRQLNYMYEICESGSWSDLIYAIDHRSWAKLSAGKMVADNLINQWNKLSK